MIEPLQNVIDVILYIVFAALITAVVMAASNEKSKEGKTNPLRVIISMALAFVLSLIGYGVFAIVIVGLLYLYIFKII